MMFGVLSWLDIYFRNMVGQTRRTFFPEVGQGSDTQGTETTQDPPLPTHPPTPMMAPIVGMDQLQQILGGVPKTVEFAKATKNYISYGGTRF